MNEIADLDAEIARIASDPARKQAFELFAEGRLAEGLSLIPQYPEGWESHSIKASIPIWDDYRLFSAIDDKFFKDELDNSKFIKADSNIEFWGWSPLEIALRKGTPEAFEQALDEVFSPKKRFEAAGKIIGRGWTSLVFTEKREFDKEDRKIGMWFDSLYLLALLLGKTDAANLIIKKGWSQFFGDSWRTIVGGLKKRMNQRPSETAKWMGFEESQLSAVISRLDEIGILEEKMLDAFETSRKDSLIKKAEKLLAENPPIGYYPLSVATERNLPDLLKKLFEHGGNPNSLYKTGIPLLSALNSKKITPELLQIWLDAGANLTVGPTSLVPFGNENAPSPIYAWASEGRLELIQQATEKSVLPFKLYYQDGENTCSPPLAAALSAGEFEVAQWMIEQGCSLDHLIGDSDTTCREVGSGRGAAKFVAWVEERALKAKHKDALSAPRPPRSGL